MYSHLLCMLIVLAQQGNVARVQGEAAAEIILEAIDPCDNSTNAALMTKSTNHTLCSIKLPYDINSSASELASEVPSTTPISMVPSARPVSVASSVNQSVSSNQFPTHAGQAQDHNGDEYLEEALMMMLEPCGSSTNATLIVNSSNFTLCNVTFSDHANASIVELPSKTPSTTTPAKQPSVTASAFPSSNRTSRPSTMPSKLRPMAPSESPHSDPSSSNKPSTSQSAKPTPFLVLDGVFPTVAPTFQLSSSKPQDDDRCSVCTTLYGTDLDPAAYTRGVLDKVGSLNTCQGFDTLLGQLNSDSRLCQSFDGRFNDIDISAYCGCPGSQYPNACQLCPGGVMNKLNQNATVKGLTCLEWFDWARATLERDACESLTKQQKECCSF
jgi:hypothetical protein